MRTTLTALILFLSITTCNPDKKLNPNCRFLFDVGVSREVNLTLPSYSQLQFAGNSVYIPNIGNAGIIIAYIGSDYFAWDAADPNMQQSACSTLINSGLTATNTCENKNEYSLVTGQPLNNGDLQCGLKFYPVQKSGNILIISN